jgi:hypothetical protein
LQHILLAVVYRRPRIGSLWDQTAGFNFEPKNRMIIPQKARWGFYAVGILVAFVFVDRIANFGLTPTVRMLPPGTSLIFTRPGEAFTFYLHIALIGGAGFEPHSDGAMCLRRSPNKQAPADTLCQ